MKYPILFQLYRRIIGTSNNNNNSNHHNHHQSQSSSHITATQTQTQTQTQSTQPLPALYDLPAELHQHIAAYLRARSLCALRCAHPALYGSDALRSTVPGLRSLRLFHHQRTSLNWMRRREEESSSLLLQQQQQQQQDYCNVVVGATTAECVKLFSNRRRTKQYRYDAQRGTIRSIAAAAAAVIVNVKMRAEDDEDDDDTGPQQRHYHPQDHAAMLYGHGYGSECLLTSFRME